MYLPIWIRVYRTLVGALALHAVVDKRQNSPFSSHFYEFFTNRAGIIVGVVLVLGGTLLALREPPPWWELSARGRRGDRGAHRPRVRPPA